MKTSHKTCLVAGLACAGLIWAGAAAFGQADPQPPVPQTFPTSEPDDPTAVDALTPAPGAVEPSPEPTAQAPATEPDPARPRQHGADIDSAFSDVTLSVRGKAVLQALGTPLVTLQDLQQADQQLGLRINRLVESYTRAIRGEEAKPVILEFDSRLLSEETGAVADPAKIREVIVQLVNEQFLIRQAMRKMEIASLEERVQRLKDLLQKREEAQDKIVESRLSQLLNAAEGLGWDSATRSNTTASPVQQAAPASAPAAGTAKIDPRFLEYYSKLVAKYDTNGDGVLTSDEWSKMSKSPEAADADGDKRITVEEYARWAMQR